MKLPDSRCIKDWDLHTLQKLGISSYQLMQHAAYSCSRILLTLLDPSRPVRVLCGPGNNGGDGYLVAKHLFLKGLEVSVTDSGEGGSHERRQARAEALATDIDFIPFEEEPNIGSEEQVVDALFGHGLTRKLEGFYARWVNHANTSGADCYSIDMPSGMPSETAETYYDCFLHAHWVLSFGRPKQSFFLEEYARYLGRILLVDIGLTPGFPERFDYLPVWLTEEYVSGLFRPKKAVSHKGDFGSVLLAGGSLEYGGAIQLNTLAALNTGVGKTFVATPEVNRDRFTELPEAILIPDCGEHHLSAIPDFENHNTVALGSGMNTRRETRDWMRAHLSGDKRWILDADALNILAAHPDWIPGGEVLITPHPGEFDRLTQKHASSGERWLSAASLAKERKWIVVLKGSTTAIFTPEGKQFIHSGGNAGLAKGGSGDLLCGLIAGFAGRGYSLEQAACLGVYLQGKAAEGAAREVSCESMKASDLVTHLQHCLSEWENWLKEA